MVKNQENQQFNCVVEDEAIEPNEAWLMQLAAIDENEDVGFIGLEDDRFSFEDSERFEEDSLCSLPSETGSLNHKWRGWAAKNNSTMISTDVPGPSTSIYCSEMKTTPSTTANADRASGRKEVPSQSSWKLKSLAEIAASKAAKTLSFETIEFIYQSIKPMEHLPESLMLPILRHCFPLLEEDIRLYSCLANGNANQFSEGEHLYQAGAVAEIFQIGYHLSAIVNVYDEIATSESNYRSYLDCASRDSKLPYDVSIRVDRGRIVSCTCSCSDSSSWCQHIVAVCLQRIHKLSSVEFRTTIWDSITELSDDKLKKLAQYLINELPREYLPVAQKLIDQLRNTSSDINNAVGAPDPTAGGHDDSAIWCMDEKALHENIRKILINFVKPSPTVHCDVQYLSSTSPPASNEWNTLIRPLRSKEPEALWNLLSIVREMLKRRDENATTLLHVITEQCMSIDPILVWWYQTCLTHSGYWHFSGYRNHTLHSHVSTTQYNAGSLCDEIVKLWRLAALNPKLSSFEREQLASLLQLYHRTAVHHIWRIVGNLSVDHYLSQNIEDERGCRLSPENASFTQKHFPGFFSALQACHMVWSELEIGKIVGELNFTNVQNIIQNQGSTSFTHTAQRLPTPKDCPNIPLLRDGSGVLLLADGVMDTDQQITAVCNTQAPYTSTTNATARSRKASKRKTKHQTRRHQQHTHKPSTSRNVLLQPLGEDPDDTEDDSTAEDIFEESGGADVVGRKKAKEEPKKKRERYADDLDALFALAHSDQNSFSMRFACCEGLLSHGYCKEAFLLAKELAIELLNSPPNVMPWSNSTATVHNDVSDRTVKSKPKQTCRHYKRHFNCDSCKAHGGITRHVVPNARALEASELVATTFTRAIHLVKILTNGSEVTTICQTASSNSLALELALKVMQNPRGPSATRSLEVYIYHLEYELFNLLHKMEVNVAELALIREVARSYVNSLKCTPINRIIVPPTIMAHFILDALSYSYQTSHEAGNSGRRNAFTPSPPSNPAVAIHRRPSDDHLALELALEVLGMRVFISETDHPMLCESIRRQRGELSMTLLLRNRDCLEKLGVILDKFLDSAVHRMYENHPSNGIFFLNNKEILSVQPKSPTTSGKTVYKEIDEEPFFSLSLFRKTSSASKKSAKEGCVSKEATDRSREFDSTPIEEEFNLVSISSESMHRQPTQDSSSCSVTTATESREEESSPRLSEFSASSSGISHGAPLFFTEKNGVAQDPIQMPLNEPTTSGGSCTNKNTLDSFLIQQQKIQQQQPRHSAETQFRFLSNHATEAQAHYMVEFAKRLLAEAGGNQSNTMFNPLHNNAAAVMGNNQVGGPHRHLHICSFLIGLYALGLNNQVSSTWPTRTYSTHVSWIQTQALEIGKSALEIVRKTWEAHLTPTEVASLADKASQSADGTVVEEAALLALSVLQKAYALTVVESTKALDQCKEHSSVLLQEACLSVEKAAEKDGVYPEVLFKVANHWLSLHKEFVYISSQNNSVIAQQPNYTVPPPPIFPPYHPQRMLPPPNILHQLSSDNSRNNVAGTTAQQASCSNHQQHRLHVSHSAPNLLPGITAANTQQLHFPTPPHGKAWPAKGQPIGGFVGHTPHYAHSIHQQPPMGSMMAPPIIPCIYGIPPPRGFPPPPVLHTNPYQQPVHSHVAGAAGMCTAYPLQPSSNQHRPPPPFYHHLQQHYHYADQQSSYPTPPPLPAATTSPPINDPQKSFLINAHRVGMRALDTMGLRNSDEGSWSFNKYSKNPNFCNEIRWLFEEVSVNIGVAYVSSFCEKLSDCVASPFLLLHFMKESMKYFQQQQQFNPFHQISVMPTFNSPPITASGPSSNLSNQFLCGGAGSQRCASGHQISTANNCPYSVNQGTAAVTIQLNVVKSIAGQAKNIMLQHLFPYPIAELMRHCLEMSYVASYNKLNYTRFGESDTDDICELVLVAREAFGMIPQNAGKMMFETYLRFVRKQKMYKKDVAQRITNCLQN